MQITPVRVHHLALTGAVGMSSIALFDAFTMAVTGHYSVFSDDAGRSWWLSAGNLVHGLAYAGLLAVLVQHGRRIDAANRTARVCRWLLTGSLAVLALGFVLVGTWFDPASLPVAAGVVIGVAFAVMLLAAPVLGVAVRREPELRPGSRLLALMAPVLVLTIAVGWLAPRFGHPAYLETLLAIGVALLGYRAARTHAPAEGAESVGSVTRV